MFAAQNVSTTGIPIVSYSLIAARRSGTSSNVTVSETTALGSRVPIRPSGGFRRSAAVASRRTDELDLLHHHYVRREFLDAPPFVLRSEADLDVLTAADGDSGPSFDRSPQYRARPLTPTHPAVVTLMMALGTLPPSRRRSRFRARRVLLPSPTFPHPNRRRRRLAPMADAMCIAESPTPPQPWTATQSPASTSARWTSAWNAVTNRQPSPAIATGDTVSGRTTAFWSATGTWTSSANAPGTGSAKPSAKEVPRRRSSGRSDTPDRFRRRG